MCPPVTQPGGTLRSTVPRGTSGRELQNMLHVALWYAKRGFHVFPLRPGSKEPATRHGCKDATLTPGDLFWPVGCNIGIATGHLVDVIDVDSVDWKVVESVPAFVTAPEIVGTVLTPRGGLHVYVPVVCGARNAQGMVPGVDYRGLGGYVVAPPSSDARGAWRWDMKPRLQGQEALL